MLYRLFNKCFAHDITGYAAEGWAHMLRRWRMHYSRGHIYLKLRRNILFTFMINRLYTARRLDNICGMATAFLCAYYYYSISLYDDIFHYYYFMLPLATIASLMTSCFFI